MKKKKGKYYLVSVYFNFFFPHLTGVYIKNYILNDIAPHRNKSSPKRFSYSRHDRGSIPENAFFFVHPIMRVIEAFNIVICVFLFCFRFAFAFFSRPFSPSPRPNTNTLYNPSSYTRHTCTCAHPLHPPPPPPPPPPLPLNALSLITHPWPKSPASL